MANLFGYAMSECPGQRIFSSVEVRGYNCKITSLYMLWVKSISNKKTAVSKVVHATRRSQK